MLLKHTVVFACLGFVSLSGAYNITANVVDGIPEALNITTEPFVKIGNGYYHIENNATKNWYEAYESCRGIGATLISFETMEEWDSIHEYLVKMKITGVYWSSGNDLAIQGKHVWHSTGEPLTLKIWGPGEPNNATGIEHCDDFWYSSVHQLMFMNDTDCFYKSFYICEAPQPKTASFVIW